MANVAYTRQRGKLPAPPGLGSTVMSKGGSIKPSKGLGARTLGGSLSMSKGGSIKPSGKAPAAPKIPTGATAGRSSGNKSF